MNVLTPCEFSSGGNPDHSRCRRVFLRALFFVVTAKLLVAFFMPLTADEAYYFLWGKYPAAGYYCHPPMAGWLQHIILRFLGDSVFALRLPAIVFSALVAWGVYALLRSHGKPARALAAALLFVFSPAHVGNLMVTTDTPLLLFSFLSIWFLARAEERGRMPDFALAGFFLGGAFLSKYFSALIVLAVIAGFFLRPCRARRFAGYALAAGMMLPAVAWNVMFNWGHDWPNLMFNAFNRNEEAVWFSPMTLTLYLLTMLYLLTPAAAFFLVRHTLALWRQLRDRDFSQTFRVAFVVPTLALLLISCSREIGLHWPVSFMPFAAFVFVKLLTDRELILSVRWAFWLTVAHVIVALALLMLPTSWMAWHKSYPSIVLARHAREFKPLLAPYMSAQATLATTSYAFSSSMEYATGHRCIVFGPGSYHGRQDDLLTDFKTLDGKNILLILREHKDAEPTTYARYFDRCEVRNIYLRGARFLLLAGYGFRYAPYRAEVLSFIDQRYYRIPAWLPTRTWFDRRYGFTETPPPSQQGQP